MSDQALFVPFAATPGEVINARSLFIDAGYAVNDGDSGPMASILQKVQSKMGTIVPGYDEDNDFIDDSDISVVNEVHALDINSFRVVLSMETRENDKQPAKSRSEDSVVEPQAVSDGLAEFLENIKRATYQPIDAQLSRIRGGAKTVQCVNLTNEMSEAIGHFVDEKVRLETELMKPQTPTKKKIDTWRKDALQAIFNQCFSIHEYQFTTMRRLQVAYNKYKKEHAPDDDDGAKGNDEGVKEAPSE